MTTKFRGMVVLGAIWAIATTAMAQTPAAPTPVPAAPPAASPAPTPPAPPAPPFAPAQPDTSGLPKKHGGPQPAIVIGPKRPHPGVKSLPPPDQNPTVRNYFEHLHEILQQEAAKSQPDPKKPGENLTEPKTYPFDALEGVTSKDIMRAAKEGARAARYNPVGQTPEQVERHVEANIRFVLEYYPIVAFDPDAYNNLYYIMEDPHAEAVFRKILFEDAFPGGGDGSLFARFLQDGIRSDLPHTYKMYGDIITNDQEFPLIRQLSMENMYAMRVADFAVVLSKDPNAKAFREAHKRDPLPKDLLDPNGFKASPSSKTAMKKMYTGFVDLANLFAMNLKTTSSAPAELREATVAILKRMKSEVPFEDPAHIDGLLAGANMKPAAGVEPAPTSKAPAKDEDALAF